MLDMDHLRRIIEISKGDKDLIILAMNFLESFEEYQHANYRMETKWKLNSAKDMSSEAARQKQYLELDRYCRVKYKRVIKNIRTLNRLATIGGYHEKDEYLSSKEKSDRREAAKEVLAFAEEIIQEPRKSGMNKPKEEEK